MKLYELGELTHLRGGDNLRASFHTKFETIRKTRSFFLRGEVKKA